MTMTLHEALEILDPFNSTPHDIYSILAYASVAHPDVGQMLDRFARIQRDATIAELERIREYTEAARATQLAAAAPMPAPNGLEKPQALVEMEEKARVLRQAELAAQKEKRAARAEARKRKTVLLSTSKPGKDKDFAYLVRKAEEELGWTGKYEQERDPKPKYSRAALRKEVSFWHNKATDVRDNLKWMQKQLIQELEFTNSGFGTKRNATIASMEILRAIVIDKGEIGANLREFWFDSLAANFKKAISLLTQDERRLIREHAPKGKVVKDLKKLIQLLKDQKLQCAMVQSALDLLDVPKRNGKDDDVGEDSEGTKDLSQSADEGSGEGEDDGDEAAGVNTDSSGDEGDVDQVLEASEADDDGEDEERDSSEQESDTGSGDESE
ncbi:unnamed protein product [Discula destructiva]